MNFIKLLSSLLTAVVLASCTGSPDQPADTTGSIDTPGTTEQVGSDETVSLFKNGETRTYVIVNKKNSLASSVKWFKDVIAEQYGTAMEVLAADDTQVPDIKFEVISGEDEDILDYTVSLTEAGTLYFCANSINAMKAAIAQFITSECYRSSDALMIPKDYMLSYDYSEESIDNSSFLSWAGHDAKMEESSDLLQTPEWFSSLVMVELRLETASIGGTFDESYDLLDHYAEVGVNGIWLCPVYERDSGNGYSNYGPHTIDPILTGVKDTTSVEAWTEMKEFVDYAHSKGIYVFMDVLTWGVDPDAPLYKEHKDWFKGKAWSGQKFNFNNEEFKAWYIDTIVHNIMFTGVDGLRCDCEPEYTGYTVFNIVRERCREQGKNIAILAEAGNTREDCYETELEGVMDYYLTDRGAFFKAPFSWFVDGKLDILKTAVDGYGLGCSEHQALINKRGTERFYMYTLAHHDFQRHVVNGNRLKIGYTAMYAPFIPLMFMGDEFADDSYVSASCLYFLNVDFSLIEKSENALFFEDVKEMIKIRRTYPENFNYYPQNHRETNMCGVTVEGLSALSAYARYADNKAILIIPNNDKDKSGVCSITVPFEKCGITGYSNYTVTDLLTGIVLAQGSAEDIKTFSAVVPYEYQGVYLVEGING